MLKPEEDLFGDLLQLQVASERALLHIAQGIDPQDDYFYFIGPGLKSTRAVEIQTKGGRHLHILIYMN